MDLDKSIGRFKIKYAVLSRLLTRDSSTGLMSLFPNNQDINLFIDINMLLQDIYREDVQSELNNEKKGSDSLSTVLSGILNLTAHYKNYFFNGGKLLNIYLLFSDKIPKFQKEIFDFYGIEYGISYYEKYRSSNTEYKMVNDLKDKVLGKDNWLKRMCDNIPNVYYVYCDKFDATMVIKYIHDKRKVPSIILTQNVSHYQLVDDDLCIIHYHSKDRSQIVTKDTIYDALFRDKVYRPKNINHKIFKFIYLMIGSKKLGIPPFTQKLSLVKTTRLIDDLLSAYTANNNLSYLSFKSILKDFLMIQSDDEKMKELDDRAFAMIGSCLINVESLIPNINNLDINLSTDIHNKSYFMNLNNYLPDHLKIQFESLYLGG